MEDLIKIKVENDQQLVSARELYKGLGLLLVLVNGWVKTLETLNQE